MDVDAWRSGPYAAADVGTPTGREYDFSARVCRRAPAIPWTAAAAIADAVAGVLPAGRNAFSHEEILAYGPGSFFCRHTDTHRSTSFKGTLLCVVD